MRMVMVLAALVALAGCGAVQAGGQYSGVPDTPLTAGRNNTAGMGYMRTDGTIVLDRETGNYQPYPRR